MWAVRSSVSSILESPSAVRDCGRCSPALSADINAVYAAAAAAAGEGSSVLSG